MFNLVNGETLDEKFGFVIAHDVGDVFVVPWLDVLHLIFSFLLIFIKSPFQFQINLNKFKSPFKQILNKF